MNGINKDKWLEELKAKWEEEYPEFLEGEEDDEEGNPIPISDRAKNRINQIIGKSKVESHCNIISIKINRNSQKIIFEFALKYS